MKNKGRPCQFENHQNYKASIEKTDREDRQRRQTEKTDREDRQRRQTEKTDREEREGNNNIMLCHSRKEAIHQP